MKWNTQFAKDLLWVTEIKDKEAKIRTAKSLLNHLDNDQIIGVGSGSTAYLALIEIAKFIKEKHLEIKFIPSSREIEITCCALGLTTTSLVNYSPDWVFDGADEVDNNSNVIKGRGGALFREKMLIVNSPKVFILVDESKLVKRLGEKFPVPVEVVPDALHYVTKELYKLNATKISMRMAVKKDGPVITESGHILLDCNFDHINLELEKDIKSITGVVESGLFINYNPEIVVSR